jgi:hypothetical protein
MSHKAKGVILIEPTQIRRFLKWSGGGGWSLWSEAKIFKTSSRDHQDQVQSDQMVLVMARHEADPCERSQTQGLRFFKLKPWGTTRLEFTQVRWFLWKSVGSLDWCLVAKDTPMRIGNNSRQPRDLTKNRQSDSLKYESTYCFSGDDEEGSCCWWWWWWLRTNQALHRTMRQHFRVLKSSCSELNISRPAKRGGWGSYHHTPVMW